MMTRRAGLLRLLVDSSATRLTKNPNWMRIAGGRCGDVFGLISPVETRMRGVREERRRAKRSPPRSRGPWVAVPASSADATASGSPCYLRVEGSSLLHKEANGRGQRVLDLGSTPTFPAAKTWPLLRRPWESRPRSTSTTALCACAPTPALNQQQSCLVQHSAIRGAHLLRACSPPIHRMFFKQVLEMPCCKQSLCTFCLHEYVAKQQAKHQPSSNDAPGDALTVPTARRARGLATAAALLPEGMACPQCASKSKAPLHLKLLQNGEEASTRYVDSPRTRAEMDRVQQKQQKIAASLPGQPANSPIKAGDDFSALSRKMLPFSAMLVEEPDESNSVTPRFPDSADASAGAAAGSAAVASATAEGADSGAGRYDSAVTSATDRYDSGAGRITGDPTEAGGALAAGPPPGAHEAPAAVMDAPDAAVTARLAAGATGTEPTAPTA